VPGVWRASREIKATRKIDLPKHISGGRTEKPTRFKPLLLRAFMIAATISKGLLRADGRHSRSANHKGEGDSNKREGSFHGHVSFQKGNRQTSTAANINPVN
jgi:hypothetical protein